jgi:hypothetical protein
MLLYNFEYYSQGRQLRYHFIPRPFIFIVSIIGTAFALYVILLPNSIYSWENLE